MSNRSTVEIERKYVIEKPSVEIMSSLEGYSSSDIIQIYLISERGVTHRIRSRAYQGGDIRYYETKKIRIDAVSSHEYEREIEKSEFDALAERISPDSHPIRKTRYTFDYLGQTFEIDVYPEWERTAIMETELPARDTVVSFPDFIRIVSEVTGDKRFSNAAMSRSFPKESL